MSAPNDAVNVLSNDEPEYEVIRGKECMIPLSTLSHLMHTCLHYVSCVCVCVCVCVCHNYYGYSSDTHVDEVLYETIKNSGEGMCSINVVLLTGNHYCR